MFGLLNINKPSGITSRTAVNRVARLVRGTKIGHAGTLDPLAEGVLVICLGQATRLVPFVHQSSKRYVATYLLGRSSPTDDVDGDVTVIESGNAPSEAELRATFAGFTGTILQRPPAFSAVKVKGERAYAIARRGGDVQLSAKPVRIHRIELLAYCYPQLILDVTCGTGMYLRSLGRDIGATLGTGAIMSALRRTEIGPFHIDASCRLESLTPVTLATELQPAIRAVAHLPQVELSAQQVTAVRHGQRIGGPDLALGLQVAAVHDGDQLVAVMEVTADSQLKPVRVFG